MTVETIAELPLFSFGEKQAQAESHKYSDVLKLLQSGYSIRYALKRLEIPRSNFYNHMAKDEQKVLLARQSELQADIMRAKPTDFSDAPSDSIGIGSIVDLEDQSSKNIQTYTVLGAWDSNPDKNILSYLTPLGQILLGKKINDIVETDVEGNKQSWKVNGLSRWIEKT